MPMTGIPPPVAPSESPGDCLPKDIVFFDGDCLFCQARVRWLQCHDRDRHLTFAPLQGELAARMLSGTGLPGSEVDRRLDGEPALSTMVVVAGVDSAQPSVFVKSRAVAAVAARLPFPWRLGGLVAWIPRSMADLAYDWVARRRHHWARVRECDLAGGGADGDNGGGKPEPRPPC